MATTAPKSADSVSVHLATLAHGLADLRASTAQVLPLIERGEVVVADAFASIDQSLVALEGVAQNAVRAATAATPVAAAPAGPGIAPPSAVGMEQQLREAILCAGLWSVLASVSTGDPYGRVTVAADACNYLIRLYPLTELEIAGTNEVAQRIERGEPLAAIVADVAKRSRSLWTDAFDTCAAMSAEPRGDQSHA